MAVVVRSSGQFGMSLSGLLALLLCAASLVQLTVAGRSGCKAFGHSCLGGFGKRVVDSEVDGGAGAGLQELLSRVEVGKLAGLEAVLRQYLYGVGGPGGAPSADQMGPPPPPGPHGPRGDDRILEDLNRIKRSPGLLNKLNKRKSSRV